MTAEATRADIDVSIAAARLRYFRFAEYVLVFAAVAAVGWAIIFAFALVLGGPDLTKLNVGFSRKALQFGLVASLAALAFGALTYVSAGRLRPKLLRRHGWLAPASGLVLMAIGILFIIQFTGFMDEARRREALSGLIYMQGFDYWTGTLVKTPEIEAKLQEIKTQVEALRTAGRPYVLQGEIAFLSGVVSFVGLWGLSRFKRARLGASTAMAQLDAIDEVRRAQTPPGKPGEPIDRRRGWLFLAAAFAALFGPYFIPMGDPTSIQGLAVGGFLGLIAGVAAFYALFRAKQYFQVSADSLLASDQRKPILFLRAFSDDPRVTAMAGVGHEGLAQLMDLSVETRLANHFMAFGPFIAVGSPQDQVPQLGAARKRLSDEDWQQAVTAWMEEASVIVMYAGTTHWVGWELKQILDGGYAEKLILLFPPVLPFPGFRNRSWLKKQMPDVERRFEATKAAFAGTKWETAWSGIGKPETVICMRFLPGGEIAVTRSTRRSKDAYELAAALAHLGVIGPRPEPALAAQTRP